MSTVPQPLARSILFPAFALAYLALLNPSLAQPAQAPPGDFLTPVLRYADAMLEKGRDTHGPVQTGLFLSALNRLTMTPLTVRPSPPGGVRRGDRPGRAWSAMNGCNPQLDQNLFRVLYSLSELTGNDKYARAVDESLSWFFRNTLSPATSLLPWGEHMSWDALHDVPISGGDDPIHEFARPWILWDRCFKLVPTESERFALGVWEHQIADHKTGGFDRHAPYFEHGPVDGKDFARHGGFYIGTWCYAYKHTGRETYLEAIRSILARFEKKRHRPDGSMVATLGPLDCHTASTMVPEPLATRLRQFAETEDELILASLPAEFAALPKWESGYAAGTLASSAMFYLGRYEQTSSPAFRQAVLDVADAYLDSSPGEDIDVWPLTFAHLISAQVAAHRTASDPKYRSAARRFAKMAVDIFWQDKPLPKASFKTDHYETITGADSLALALLQLHAAEHNLTTPIPSNTIDR